MVYQNIKPRGSYSFLANDGDGLMAKRLPEHHNLRFTPAAFSANGLRSGLNTPDDAVSTDAPPLQTAAAISSAAAGGLSLVRSSTRLSLE
jgi:hypothetical protein